MTELIGDTCMPEDLFIPPKTTAISETISGSVLMSGVTLMSGYIIWNTTTGAAEIWSGTQWLTIDTTAR